MYCHELLALAALFHPFLLYATAAAIALSDCALLCAVACVCLPAVYVDLCVCACMFDCICVRYVLLWPLVR